LPCATAMKVDYSISDVALSIPRMLTREGVVRSFEVRLPEEEMEKLRRAQKSVRSALDGAGVK